MIEKVYLPSAIRYGINFDTFWKLNPKYMDIYQESYTENIKQEQELTNYNAWLHNQYTLMAIGNALQGKKCKYPKKPFEMKQKAEIPETKENYLLEMKSMFAKLNRGLEKKEGTN